MGCSYSCCKAPAAGEYVTSNNSNSRNGDFIQKNLTKRTLSSNPRSNDVQNYTQKDSTKNGNNRNSRWKDDSKIVEDNGEFIDPASEGEDVCPTCFEEYTLENPKIGTKCCHVFHLSCIYEWKMRSEKCPICGKVLEVESLTFD